MDFKRIQIIFLVTFVIIDVFLFSLFHRNQSTQTNNINSSNTTSIISEVHSDQISFRHVPSNQTRNGYYVSASKTRDLHSKMSRLRNQNAHYDGFQITSSFKQPLPLNSSHPHTTINHLLKKQSFVPFGKQYRYCYDLSNPSTLVYVQKAEKGGRDDIFSPSSEIRFHISDGLLNSYTQRHVRNVKNLREKSRTISARRAIALLYQYNNIPNGTRIMWCHFAYTQLLAVKGSYVYIPTWVIKMKLSDHSVVYRKMNAFNGSIIHRKHNLRSEAE